MKHNVVWKPLKGSQVFAFTSPADITLYHGGRGFGKTLTQLMRFRRKVGIGYGKFWRGVIFDMEFDNLSGLVAESKKWFPQFNDGCKFLSAASQYKWVWPTGEELLFRHVKKPEDYEGFHGHEYPFIGWNELTKYPTSELFDLFMSTNRSSFTPEIHTPVAQNDTYCTHNGMMLPEIPLEVFATTNPNGAGRNWVKRKFIDAAESGRILKQSFNVFNPKTQKEELIEKSQVAIFGSYRENKFLPASYVAELESIKDENLRKAWLFGNWDVNAGGAFDDVWDSNIHIIPRFPIPEGWRIDRTFDWGSTHPFSVGWWAEANGEEVQFPYGNSIVRFCPPKGTLFQIFEYYGTQEIGSNKGLRISPTEIAQNIIEIENELLYTGWIKTKPYAGAADNQIRNVNDIETLTIEQRMMQAGVEWTNSDKSAGSRAMGFTLFRELLENSKRGEGSGIYFMQNCSSTIAILPNLQRDFKKIDDVDTHSEDHIWDMIRYKILSMKKDLILSRDLIKFG